MSLGLQKWLHCDCRKPQEAKVHQLMTLGPLCDNIPWQRDWAWSFCLTSACSQTRLVQGKDSSKDQRQNDPVNVKRGSWWFCYSLTLKVTIQRGKHFSCRLSRSQFAPTKCFNNSMLSISSNWLALVSFCSYRMSLISHKKKPVVA